MLKQKTDLQGWRRYLYSRVQCSLLPKFDLVVLNAFDGRELTAQVEDLRAQFAPNSGSDCLKQTEQTMGSLSGMRS
jgi:hypothetical protein